MNVAYVRVSTVEQNDERQREALQRYNIDKWYSEKLSAKDKHRPQLREMLEFVREGDTLYIKDFSRIARSTKDLLDIVDDLTERKIQLISIKENLDTSSSTGRLMLTLIAAIYEFERANMLERQREGISIAVREGRYKGREKLEVPNLAEHMERVKRGEVTKRQLCRDLKISPPTLYKLIGKHEAAAS